MAETQKTGWWKRIPLELALYLMIVGSVLGASIILWLLGY